MIEEALATINSETERLINYEQMISDNNGPEKIEIPSEVFDNEANTHFFNQPEVIKQDFCAFKQEYIAFMNQV